MIDIHSSADRMIDLLRSLQDEQLSLATPCSETSVGDLVDHVGSLSVAFTVAATKELGEHVGPPPSRSVKNLTDDWRDRIRADLTRLAAAWDEPEAWQGLTQAGGVELPGEIAGVVALDELVVHGWDIAIATGQPYTPSVAELETAISFVAALDAPRDGSLFGPIVSVPDNAPLLDQLVGLTGRDPQWHPPSG